MLAGALSVGVASGIVASRCSEGEEAVSALWSRVEHMSKKPHDYD
jgi:hypothetical protein